MFGSRFLGSGSTDSEKVYSFGNCYSRDSFLLVQSIRYFCTLTQKMGLKWVYRRLRVTQMAGVIRSGDVVFAAVVFSLQWLHSNIIMMAGVVLLSRSVDKG